MYPILSNIYQKEKRLVIGLMSGTSADGIDAVLTQISGYGTEIEVRELDFLFLPFSSELRQRILQIAQGDFGGATEICRMSSLLGQLYADACLLLCQKADIPTTNIDLIGNHGQTVWHMPVSEHYIEQSITGTLQIGQDAIIAEVMKCPVIGDFRVRDMAAGGLGAPLVPYTEYLLYRSTEENIALQNIGGIGNISLLPKDCSLEQVTAFDTGPGNMIMDLLTEKITKGVLTYDKNGELAAQGTVNMDLLTHMMKDPYLTQSLPKTTGREYFGPAYVNNLLKKSKELHISLTDTLTTATCFTATSIAFGIEHFCSHALPTTLIVGGGGAHNPTLLSYLKKFVANCNVVLNEDLGYNSDAKEAIAFAILANESLGGNCNNVPSVTGASHPVIMGKISF